MWKPFLTLLRITLRIVFIMFVLKSKNHSVHKERAFIQRYVSVVSILLLVPAFLSAQINNKVDGQ
ncbi:MAG TPA: hypothetical protein VK890_11065, partial [Bacteroidia bacterium]|nr:hypothetical protein [Bacteroidia bacterium]